MSISPILLPKRILAILIRHLARLDIRRPRLVKERSGKRPAGSGDDGCRAAAVPLVANALEGLGSVDAVGAFVADGVGRGVFPATGSAPVGVDCHFWETRRWQEDLRFW